MTAFDQPPAPDQPPASEQPVPPPADPGPEAPPAPLVHAFTADGPIDLTVQHLRGNLRVRAEHGPEVRVELRPHGQAGRELASRMRVDFTGEHLRVSAPADEAGAVGSSFGELFRGPELTAAAGTAGASGAERAGAAAGFTDRLGAALRTLVRSAGEIGSALDVEIVVPAQSRAVISVGVGDIRLSGPFARADLKGGTGDVELAEAGGSARLITGTGDVSVGTLRGQATATTGTGSVRVRRAERGTLRTRTGVGEIEVRVLEGTATRLDLATGLGRRTVELTPAAQDPEAERTLEIEARAGTGDIRILRAEG